MTRLALALLAVGMLAHSAAADPTWSQIAFTTTASNAPKIVAASDKLMSSEIGKEFPGKLLLQVNVADGANPATHTFAPIYRTTAERETFVQKMLASDAWREFQATLEKTSTPVSTVLYRTVKSWGDINETDIVWMTHAFSVSDPAGFMSAVDGFMTSETGKKFPGQVYVSAVVAGGISPVTHVISVGYASETEMDSWAAVRNASTDWATYQNASEPTAEYLGAAISRTVKSWGPATLQQIVAP